MFMAAATYLSGDVDGGIGDIGGLDVDGGGDCHSSAGGDDDAFIGDGGGRDVGGGNGSCSGVLITLHDSVRNVGGRGLP